MQEKTDCCFNLPEKLRRETSLGADEMKLNFFVWERILCDTSKEHFAELCSLLPA